MPAADGDRVGQHAGAHHPAVPAHQVATAHAPAVLNIYTSLHLRQEVADELLHHAPRPRGSQRGPPLRVHGHRLVSAARAVSVSWLVL